MSSRQPSPSSIEPTEPFYAKDLSFSENSLLLQAVSSPKEEPFCASPMGEINTYFPSEGSSPSLAVRRGSNPPPRMFLPSINESSHNHTNMVRSHAKLVRSQSFSLPDLDDGDVMEDVSLKQSDDDEFNGKGKEPIENADASSGSGESQSENNDSDHNMQLCYVI